VCAGRLRRHTKRQVNVAAVGCAPLCPIRARHASLRHRRVHCARREATEHQRKSGSSGSVRVCALMVDRGMPGCAEGERSRQARLAAPRGAVGRKKSVKACFPKWRAVPRGSRRRGCLPHSLSPMPIVVRRARPQWEDQVQVVVVGKVRRARCLARQQQAVQVSCHSCG